MIGSPPFYRYPSDDSRLKPVTTGPTTGKPRRFHNSPSPVFANDLLHTVCWLVKALKGNRKNLDPRLPVQTTGPRKHSHSRTGPVVYMLYSYFVVLSAEIYTDDLLALRCSGEKKMQLLPSHCSLSHPKKTAFLC